MGTPIQGKIFQMYNKETGANKERRFPITVIEGVLGLSSYLQNQFSSLADIYMPIGGIYQSNTGQEFVYRATPNTIKAKSFTLDRIQGKSLAWNQLESCENWFGVSGNTVVSITGGYRVTSPNRYIQPISYYDKNFISGHKYLASFTIANNSLAPSGGNNQLIIYNSAVVQRIYCSNAVGYNSVIFTSEATATAGIQYQLYFSAENITVDILYPQIIDLTLLYGNEISGMTDAEILAKFESEYPGYYAYNAGKLISNDASALETVGFNQWDEQWELGTIDNNGILVPSTTSIRSKNPIRVLQNTTYCYHTGTGQGWLHVFYYDMDMNFISSGGWPLDNQVISTPMGCAYIRFAMYSSYGTTYNHDICINLSDSSFNGQYEPYRKSVLPLNLDDFWVKDGQGNQVHITGGLKSAGSVYDEIVGNKYIKRVGSVDLGTLTWDTYTNSGGKMSFWANLADAKINAVTNILSARHIGASESYVYGSQQLDKTICIHSGLARIYVADLTYSTAEAFKTAMNSVIANYELATPIEYDLVEPLIYTMKAGTTEARISPNEDGLSAPFCCDMTYSASDNNDADNAQYAATAGRLLNTHTILGQQFNGTQDIGGAISDVSSIDGAIHFDLTNPNSPLVGIAKTNPTVRLDVNGEIKGSRLHSTVDNGTAPLTVNSSTLVSNLNVEKVGGKTLAEILASDITGNAKTATNAKSESKDDQEFMFRKTNVAWDAKSGVVKKIKGKTLAWNQILDKKNNAVTSYGVTFTPNGDGSYAVSGTASGEAEYYIVAGATAIIPSGHKVLVRIAGGAGKVGYTGYNASYNTCIQNSLRSGIITLSLDLCKLELRVNSGVTANSSKVFLSVYDLTLMFGAGNEPTTVEEFESLFPESYYDYNAGTLISNNAESLETVGFNQWDGVLESGYWNANTGEPESGTNWKRSKNPIKAFPNTAYYWKANPIIVSGVGYLVYYDAEMNYIGSSVGEAIQRNNVHTTPSNCRFVHFYVSAAYVESDICINLSDSAKNGTYEPYRKTTMQLGLNNFKVKDGNGNIMTITGGLKSAGSVYDEIVGNKYVKRVGSVDLSTMTWSYTNSRLITSSLVGIIKETANGDVPNAITPKHIPVPYTSIDGSDKAFTVIFPSSGSHGQLWFKDSAYSDAASFKTAMSGVMLNYELATPEEYDLVDPIPSVYPCDQYGTERIISPESTTPSAPFIADLQYGAKSDDVAKELIDTRATVQPLLDAFEYDSTNEAWRLKGNFYADGFVSAYGTNESEALEALKAWVTANFEPKQS